MFAYILMPSIHFAKNINASICYFHIIHYNKGKGQTFFWLDEDNPGANQPFSACKESGEM